MPYRFIFLTWLLALPVNLITVMLALSVGKWMQYGETSLPLGLMDYERILLIALFSIPFSLPGLFGLMMVVWIAREFLFDAGAQFFFICISCCFLIAGCYFLLEVVLSPRLQVRDYGLLLAASITAIIMVLLFTRRYYYSYINSLP